MRKFQARRVISLEKEFVKKFQARRVISLEKEFVKKLKARRVFSLGKISGLNLWWEKEFVKKTDSKPSKCHELFK